MSSVRKLPCRDSKRRASTRDAWLVYEKARHE